MRAFNKWSHTNRMITYLKYNFTRNYLVQIEAQSQQWWNWKQGYRKIHTTEMLHPASDDTDEGLWEKFGSKRT